MGVLTTLSLMNQRGKIGRCDDLNSQNQINISHFTLAFMPKQSMVYFKKRSEEKSSKIQILMLILMKLEKNAGNICNKSFVCVPRKKSALHKSPHQTKQLDKWGGKAAPKTEKYRENTTWSCPPSCHCGAKAEGAAGLGHWSGLKSLFQLINIFFWNPGNHLMHIWFKHKKMGLGCLWRMDGGGTVVYKSMWRISPKILSHHIQCKVCVTLYVTLSSLALYTCNLFVNDFSAVCNDW